jgi:hypothetical protein
MKAYLVYDRGAWGEELHLLGLFLHKSDAIEMALASDLDPKHSIKEFELIE